MPRPLRIVALLAVVALMALVASSCGGDDDDEAGGGEGTLVGSWQWERTGYSNDTESVPDDPSKYTVEFLEDGTMTIVADCNSSSGTWESDAPDAESGSLAIELGPTTLVACEEGSLSDVYLRDLAAAGVFFLRDGNLGIDLFADSGTMIFAPAS